jgi:hypothetical protein
MSTNPNDPWGASSMPGIITPEQTLLWQAGVQWLNATVGSDSIPPQPAPSEPTKNEGDGAAP